MKLTRRQAQEVDRIAVERLGMSALVLMENAGLLSALAIRDKYDLTAGVTVLAGGGGNGGDGYVVARQLALRGTRVRVVTTSSLERTRADARHNRELCLAAGIPVQEAEGAMAGGIEWGAEVIVDALLGTGFQGELRREAANLVAAANASGAPIVALDLPSGLDADTGRPATVCVRAERTLTYVAPKVGFEQPSARRLLGEVQVIPIGVPLAVLDEVLGSPPETGS